MPVSRDTSADAAAELMCSLQPGASAPGLTLDGVDAERLRAAIRDAHAELLEIEESTKEYRRRQRIRTRRIVLAQALALLAPRGA